MKRVLAQLILIGAAVFAVGTDAQTYSVSSVYFDHFKPAVVAHRGAADQESKRYGFHEGTIEAYRYAAGLNVEVLEMDIHKTTDNRLAVHHDDKLPKLCSGQDKIHNLSLTQLKACKSVIGYEIPELREILRAFPGRRMTIEMKTPDNSLFKNYDGIETLLINELRSSGQGPYVSVSSVSGTSTRNFRNMTRGISNGLSAGEQVGFLLCYTARLPQWACIGVPKNSRYMMETPFFHKDLTLLGVNFTIVSLVTQSFVNHAHKYNYRVNYWTVNAAADVARVFGTGADGVITDNPALAQSVR